VIAASALPFNFHGQLRDWFGGLCQCLHARDKMLIDILRSIGIEKGKPFNPDAKTHDILTSAAREAHALLESRYEDMFAPYFDISRWALPAFPDYLKASQDGFSDPNAYPFDSRVHIGPLISKMAERNAQFFRNSRLHLTRDLLQHGELLCLSHGRELRFYFSTLRSASRNIPRSTRSRRTRRSIKSPA
jgi:hypothetical protein